MTSSWRFCAPVSMQRVKYTITRLLCLHWPFLVIKSIHYMCWMLYHDSTICAYSFVRSGLASETMMTSLNENIFRVTGLLCGEFTGHRSIPLTKASDAELWCFVDLRLNKRLNKQPWGWWFETPSRSSWRHSNQNFGWHAGEPNLTFWLRKTMYAP